MTTLTKHLQNDIKVNSKTRLQRMQDRQAILKSISSINEVRNELLLITIFGGSLLILCISMAQTILNKGL